jgi:hypothetical protein
MQLHPFPLASNGHVRFEFNSELIMQFAHFQGQKALNVLGEIDGV